MIADRSHPSAGSDAHGRPEVAYTPRSIGPPRRPMAASRAPARLRIRLRFFGDAGRAACPGRNPAPAGTAGRRSREPRAPPRSSCPCSPIRPRSDARPRRRRAPCGIMVHGSPRRTSNRSGRRTIGALQVAGSRPVPQGSSATGCSRRASLAQPAARAGRHERGERRGAPHLPHGARHGAETDPQRGARLRPARAAMLGRTEIATHGRGTSSSSTAATAEGAARSGRRARGRRASIRALRRFAGDPRRPRPVADGGRRSGSPLPRPAGRPPRRGRPGAASPPSCAPPDRRFAPFPAATGTSPRAAHGPCRPAPHPAAPEEGRPQEPRRPPRAKMRRS